MFLFLFNTLARRSNVVDFQNHSDQLRGQVDLLLLADQSLDDLLRFHVVRAGEQTVNAQSRIVLFHVSRLELG